MAWHGNGPFPVANITLAVTVLYKFIASMLFSQLYSSATCGSMFFLGILQVHFVGNDVFG
jgi:hypothetical protein